MWIFEIVGITLQTMVDSTTLTSMAAARGAASTIFKSEALANEASGALPTEEIDFIRRARQEGNMRI